MSNLGLKEKSLLAMLAVVLIYALAVMLWFTTCRREWTSSANKYQKACRDFTSHGELISRKGEFEESYEAARKALPKFKLGKDPSSDCVNKIEALSKQHNVYIGSLEPKGEEDEGEVMTFKVAASRVTASLEALVRFLHALENSDEGLFIVRKLDMKSSNNGYLNGSLEINCAYMRGEDMDDEDESDRRETPENGKNVKE